LKSSSDHRNPVSTVDIIIRYGDGIILIKRRNPPEGWAFPGGFVDYGETLEDAAIREAREETGLAVRLIRQFHTYSDPRRDPRQHTISTVFIAEASGRAEAGDDAGELSVFDAGNLPESMAFDHKQILNDYFTGRY
jgi:ADP-ribose pyrophosphatase YjhB (NUDIX family)